VDAARIGDRAAYASDPAEQGTVRWVSPDGGELGIHMDSTVWLQVPLGAVESIEDGLVVLRGRPIKVLCPAASGTN
jgi:hypothetical protein